MTGNELVDELVATCQRLSKKGSALTHAEWEAEYQRLLAETERLEQAGGPIVDLEPLVMIDPRRFGEE